MFAKLWSGHNFATDDLLPCLQRICKAQLNSTQSHHSVARMNTVVGEPVVVWSASPHVVTDRWRSNFFILVWTPRGRHIAGTHDDCLTLLAIFVPLLDQPTLTIRQSNNYSTMLGDYIFEPLRSSEIKRTLVPLGWHYFGIVKLSQALSVQALYE